MGGVSLDLGGPLKERVQVDLIQVWEWRANDSLRHLDDPLQLFLLHCGAAGEAHFAYR